MTDDTPRAPTCIDLRYQVVSSDTLQPRDLIHAFSYFLRAVIPHARDYDISEDVVAEHRELLEEADLLLVLPEEDFELLNPEEIEDTVAALADALDAYSPKGFWFGAHEGDGALFGYWHVSSLPGALEDEEDEEDDD